MELRLNNCNIGASFTCEPGNTSTMLSPLKWSIWRVGVGGGGWCWDAVDVELGE